jgi:hypothetical protein
MNRHEVIDAPLEAGIEEGGGAGAFVGGDLFWCAVGEEVDAFGAGFGEDVGVVLDDDDDGAAFIDEALGDLDEAFHVGHVEAEGWAARSSPSFGLDEGWRQVFW